MSSCLAVDLSKSFNDTKLTHLFPYKCTLSTLLPDDLSRYHPVLPEHPQTSSNSLKQCQARPVRHVLALNA